MKIYVLILLGMQCLGAIARHANDLKRGGESFGSILGGLLGIGLVILGIVFQCMEL